MRRTMLLMRLFATLGLTLWMVGSASFQVAAQDDESGTPTAAQEESGNTTGDTTEEPTDESTEEPVDTQEEEQTPEEEPSETPDENQDQGDTGTQEEPTPEEEATPVTGTLSVHAYTCTAGGDPGTGAISTDDPFSSDENCTEGTATITIDGGDANEVASSADFTLDEGTHSIADTTTGASADVEVTADGTTISVVAYAEPDVALSEAPAAEEEPATTVLVITHDCAPQIQTVDDLNALTTVSDKYRLCPVVTLPADPADPSAFDYTFGKNNPSTILDVAPTEAQICESDLGEDTDNDPSTDPCFDNTGYAVTASGPTTTVIEKPVPDNRVFGTAESDGLKPNLEENPIPEKSRFILDTTGDASIVAHVYNFSPGVNVVVHLCPETEASDADFETKLKDCPATTLDNPDGPVSSASDSLAAFDVTVTDAGVTQDITAAAYLPKLACESGLKVNIDDDDGTDFCLAGYAYRGVAPGTVTIAQTPPDGYKFGTAEVAPASADPLPDVQDGVVSLDTTNDSDVTVHLFNFAAPDSGGGEDPGENAGGGDDDDDNGNNAGEGDDDDDDGNNAPGGGEDTGDGSGNGNGGEQSGETGSAEIYMLYCLADSEYVDIEALSPGEQADPYSFGDDTCLQDGNEFQIVEFSRNDQPPFDVGFDGYEMVDGLPSTAGEDPHLIIDTWSGVYAPFEIEPNTVTEIVVLVFELNDYYEDDPDDSYEDQPDDYSEDQPDDYTGDDPFAAEDQYANDEENVEDGEDLPDTGVSMTATPDPNRDLFLLLGLGGALALGGAYRLRRFDRR